jgi:cellulose synthase operon protein C
MRRYRPSTTAAVVLATALGLAGCDTAEERAEAHYQRALALIAEDDVDRAMVELRNVFRLDGQHAAARLEYANRLVERGETREAISQYLRLVEQDWSNVAGTSSWPSSRCRSATSRQRRPMPTRAYELDPDDPEIRAFKAAVDLRRGDRAAAVAMARGWSRRRPTTSSPAWC